MTGRVISISAARPQAGKSTLAELLAKRMNAVRLSFADALRDNVAGLFLGAPKEWVIQAMKDGKLKDLKSADFAVTKIKHDGYFKFLRDCWGCDLYAPMSLRDHLRLYGTEYIRNYKNHPNHWRDITLTEAFAWKLKGRNVVIDDLRFPNEAEGMAALDGEMIYIHTDRGNEGDDPCEGHIEADMCDYVVSNFSWRVPEGMLDDLAANDFFGTEEETE